MLQRIKNKIELNFISLLIQFLISYIKYLFLTGSVIFSIVVLLFIILNINPRFSFGFLQYFSFINPVYKTGTFSMGIKETMQIFSVVSLVFMIIVSLVKTALKKIFKLDILITFKSKIIIVFVPITLTYIIASVIVAFSDNLDKGFYFIFAIFYIINLVSVVFYFLFDGLLKWIVQLFEKRENPW